MSTVASAATAAAAPGEPTAPARAVPAAMLAALITVALWASAFVGIRSAGRALAPGPLALARLLVASLALGALVLARREPLVRRPGLPA